MKRRGLCALGFTPALAEAFVPLEAEGLVPGRVVAGLTARLVRVGTADGELTAEIAGSLRHRARGSEEMPAVGDWVALKPGAGEKGAVLQQILPRRTSFVRRAAGDRTVAQVLAANVDTVFLVMGLDADFNPRRLERALVLAFESGAAPVVLLNKADLACDLEAQRGLIETVAHGVPVCVVAAKPGEGLERLSPWLVAGRTVALLGSSGVGKSTILNRLLGSERQKTREVRASDQRGRHTTTHRELFVLPSGALLLDTPGLREIQLWSDGGAGVDAAFDDVVSLATTCRFTTCRHTGEPGCAVAAAIGGGRLDAARLDSYLKLQAEVRSLEIREDPLQRRAERGRTKAAHKSLRKGKRD